MDKKDIPAYAIEAESTLKTMASIILILGLIGGVIYGLSSALVEVPDGYYSTKYQFHPAGLLNGLVVCLQSIAAWAILKVLAEISITLKRIFHYHVPDYYVVKEISKDPNFDKVYIWKRYGKKVKYSYKMGETKYYKDAETGIGVGSIAEDELELIESQENETDKE